MEENNFLLLGLSLLILTYLPGSNLLVTVGFVVAERVLYLPSLGVAIILVTGWRKLIRFSVSIDSKKLNTGLKLLFYLLLLSFMMKTINRNRVWHNRSTLFESGLISVPNNAKVHYNYANMQKDLGNLKIAETHYRIAINLWPRHESSYNNLGTILKDFSESEKLFRQVIHINPYHAKAHFNLANLYSKKGLNEKAISWLKRSIDLDPNLGEAYSVLASVYYRTNRVSEAETLHRKALKISPWNSDFINNYAAFLQSTGRTTEAIEMYRQAVFHDPNHQIAKGNLLQILASNRTAISGPEEVPMKT